MAKRKFKLLTKTVFIYLVFTFLSFLISAFIIQREANKHMYRILDQRFRHREHYISRVLKHRPEKLLNSREHTIRELPNLPADSSPVFTDTLITDPQTQRDLFYRKKIVYLTVNNKYYRVEMLKEAEELQRFKDDVFHIVLPVFLILAGAILIANYLMSGIFFKPFRKILKQMDSYKIGSKTDLTTVKTTTYEFDRLKELYGEMRSRIERDYRNLKEYTENMSHELQTPLSIIQTKTESLLSANKLTGQQASQVKTIYEQVQQLSKLGQALNLLTKIENAEFKDIEKIPTMPLICEHIYTVEEMSAIKSLSIESDLNDKHTFTMNKDLLHILIRNLLKNALRYAPPSSKILIRSDEEALVFMNEGPPPSFPANDIFERFKKGSEGKSLGLGLSIAKRICEASGLTIEYKYADEKHQFFIRSLD